MKFFLDTIFIYYLMLVLYFASSHPEFHYRNDVVVSPSTAIVSKVIIITSLIPLLSYFYLRFLIWSRLFRRNAETSGHSQDPVSNAVLLLHTNHVKTFLWICFLGIKFLPSYSFDVLKLLVFAGIFFSFAFILPIYRLSFSHFFFISFLMDLKFFFWKIAFENLACQFIMHVVTLLQSAYSLEPIAYKHSVNKY